MSVQRLNALTLLFTIAFAALAFWLYEPKPRQRPRLSELAAIPSDATFVASVDVARLRGSELGRALLSTGRELPGVGRLDAVCGFDPSDAVRSVAIAERGGEVGVVATGEFALEPIARCAEAVITKRGGAPARTPVSSFVSVRDRSQPSGELAVRNHGPVLLGEGRFLRDMIDTFEGRSQNLRRDPVHASLRDRLGDSAAATVTWKLAPGWLERVSGEPLAAKSPLAEVRAAGLRLDVAPEIRALGLLVCSSSAACDEVASVIGDLTRDLGPLLKQELGENPLEGAEVDRSEGAVRLRVTLTHDRATAIVRRVALRLLVAPDEEPTPAPLPPASSAPPLVPDEVLRP